MTQKQIRTCDRCGKEQASDSQGMTFHISPGMVYMLLPCFSQDGVKHLCGECTTEFNHFMTFKRVIEHDAGTGK